MSKLQYPSKEIITNHDVADYYDSTLIHYKQWWKLKKHLGLHYGIWLKGTRTFGDALINTNRIMSQIAKIKSTDIVLDAGCGVGGTVFFIHTQTGAQVTGITLSEKQLAYANDIARTQYPSSPIEFLKADYLNTPFEDGSFDVIWACESMCHAKDKQQFLEECHRLLRKNGRLIIADFFLPTTGLPNPHDWIEKWQQTWAVPDFTTAERLNELSISTGFEKVEYTDYTLQIRRSSKKMYQSAMMACVPSELYKIINPKVSRYARNHYKCGVYQYKALKAGLWNYNLFLATKR